MQQQSTGLTTGSPTTSAIHLLHGNLVLLVIFLLQGPLVGTEAPDFVAEAVYDQEFQTISLSQYRVFLC